MSSSTISANKRSSQAEESVEESKKMKLNGISSSSSSSTILQQLSFDGNEIQIYGTIEEPLFKANDIGRILGIKDIRTTLRNMDEDEWHSMPISDSLGRLQQTNMLTEQGLHKMFFISRKPIAKLFQKEVTKILKTIRLTGRYDLEEELKKKEQMLEQQTKLLEDTKENVTIAKMDIKQTRSNTLISSFKTRSGVYILDIVSGIQVEDLPLNGKLKKFGSGGGAGGRAEAVLKQLSQLGVVAYVEDIIPCMSYSKLENDVKQKM